jgi:large repetitive protein
MVEQSKIVLNSGDNIFTGTVNADTVEARGGNDRIDGAGGADRIDGGAGNDFLSGGKGNDILHAGQGDDIIRGGAGDDVIDGGEGFDRAVYRGELSDYKISMDNLGRLHIQDLVGDRDGTDTVVRVEEFSFHGHIYSLADLIVA